MRESSIQLLSDLANAHGASGSESAVRKIFRHRLGPDLITDRNGSIAASAGDGGPRVMVVGHMDEVGFMVQSITAAGLIRFVPLGGWWGHTLLAKRVRILTRNGTEVLGVISAKPPHFLAASEREKVLTLDKMRIDIGAVSAEDVRQNYGIEVGDTIVPDSPFTPLANPDVFVAKAFDDRLGLGLTIETMEQLTAVPLPNTLYCVGSVQEEVGVRGAQTAARLVNPDVAIVVEAPPADDQPEVAADERQGIMGGGPQLRMMDPTAISNRRLVDFIVDTAKAADIPLQLAVRDSGGTDAKAIHLSGIGVPTVVLGVPTRYIHTHNSMMNINDYLSALKLLTTLIPKLTPEVVAGFTDFSDS